MLRFDRLHLFRLSGPDAPDSTGGDLRARTERLLSAGADVIERSLSGDSAAFNAANLQEGGQ